jgi:hypothetical protein
MPGFGRRCVHRDPKSLGEGGGDRGTMIEPRSYGGARSKISRFASSNLAPFTSPFAM